MLKPIITRNILARIVSAIGALAKLARAVDSGARADIVAAIDSALEIARAEIAISGRGKHWARDLAKLRAVALDGKARFSILALDGNGKLPFLAFSALPGLPFCAGAGACLKFCYSFKSWRYPAAFCRQAQNSILLASAGGRSQILRALDACKPETGAIDFRLYVDGDFNSAGVLAFWMDALRARPWLACYGYSKSLALLVDYAEEWPSNYLFNLSSGHRHHRAMVARAKSLACYRGDFVAVDIGRKVKSAEIGSPEISALVREKFGARCFVCPGKCGDCTPKGHACGSARFKGIPIVIPTH